MNPLQSHVFSHENASPDAPLEGLSAVTVVAAADDRRVKDLRAGRQPKSVEDL